MPSAVVQSIAHKTGKPVGEIEGNWDRAKELTHKSYPKLSEKDNEYWALVNSLTHKISGVKETYMATNTSLKSKYPNAFHIDGSKKEAYYDGLDSFVKDASSNGAIHQDNGDGTHSVNIDGTEIGKYHTSPVAGLAKGYGKLAIPQGAAPSVSGNEDIMYMSGDVQSGPDAMAMGNMGEAVVPGSAPSYVQTNNRPADAPANPAGEAPKDKESDEVLDRPMDSGGMAPSVHYSVTEGSEAGARNADLMKQYNDNERENLHTANAVLLAKHFGTPEEHEEAKGHAANLLRYGHGSQEGSKFQYQMSQKYAHHLDEAAGVDFLRLVTEELAAIGDTAVVMHPFDHADYVQMIGDLTDAGTDEVVSSWNQACQAIQETHPDLDPASDEFNALVAMEVLSVFDDLNESDDMSNTDDDTNQVIPTTGGGGATDVDDIDSDVENEGLAPFAKMIAESMSKKDYVPLAKALADNKSGNKNHKKLCNDVADIMQRDNPNFKRNQFLDAANALHEGILKGAGYGALTGGAIGAVTGHIPGAVIGVTGGAAVGGAIGAAADAVHGVHHVLSALHAKRAAAKTPEEAKKLDNHIAKTTNQLHKLKATHIATEGLGAALIGGLAGGAAGSLVGHTLAGAALGAGAGEIVNKELDKDDDKDKVTETSTRNMASRIGGDIVGSGIGVMAGGALGHPFIGALAGGSAGYLAGAGVGHELDKKADKDNEEIAKKNVAKETYAGATVGGLIGAGAGQLLGGHPIYGAISGGVIGSTVTNAAEEITRARANMKKEKDADIAAREAALRKSNKTNKKTTEAVEAPAVARSAPVVGDVMVGPAVEAPNLDVDGNLPQYRNGVLVLAPNVKEGLGGGPDEEGMDMADEQADEDENMPPVPAKPVAEALGEAPGHMTSTPKAQYVVDGATEAAPADAQTADEPAYRGGKGVEAPAVSEAQWTAAVTAAEKSHPKAGLYATGSAEEIAKSEKAREGSAGGAIKAITFYKTRAGSNLPSDRKGTLDKAIDILHKQLPEGYIPEAVSAKQKAKTAKIHNAIKHLTALRIQRKYAADKAKKDALSVEINNQKTLIDSLR